MDSAFIWGTVVPSYLGAIGTIAASAIAAVALFRDVSTRKGLREVATAASDTSPTVTPTLAYPARPPAGESKLELTTRGKQTVLRNLSNEPITISSLEVPSGGKDLTLRQSLPVKVEPGEGLGFNTHHKLGGPAIAALLVQWIDEEGNPKTSRFFI